MCPVSMLAIIHNPPSSSSSSIDPQPALHGAVPGALRRDRGDRRWQRRSKEGKGTDSVACHQANSQSPPPTYMYNVATETDFMRLEGFFKNILGPRHFGLLYSANVCNGSYLCQGGYVCLSVNWQDYTKIILDGFP